MVWYAVMLAYKITYKKKKQRAWGSHIGSVKKAHNHCYSKDNVRVSGKK